MTNCSNVIFSYVSYRRNIKDVPFVNKLADFEQAVGIARSISEIFGDELELKSLKNMSLKQCLELEEKGIITKDLIENKDVSAYGISDNGEKRVYINEQDHIRLMCIKNGFNLDVCFNTANQMDDLLLEKLEMCFNVSLGYLTANPMLMGTGLEVGCLLFIPSIIKSGLLDKIKKDLLKSEFVGLSENAEEYKNNSPFVLIKNTYTFGYKENQFAEKLYKIVEKIIELEKAEENKLFNVSASTLVDDIFRNFGVAKNAYRLSYEESETLLGSVMWGVNLNILKQKKQTNVFNFLSAIKEHHISSGKQMSIKDTEKIRAKKLSLFLTENICKGEVDV